MKPQVMPVKLNEARDKLVLLDQTKLPVEERWIELDRLGDVWEAIKMLRVRGAPAIGIAAAFGLYVHMRQFEGLSPEAFEEEFHKAKQYLATSRPTAVNLFWALDRMENRFAEEKGRPLDEMNAALLAESEAILAEDLAMGEAIGRHGLSLLKPGMGLLTHCNAGALATSGYGTALAPMYAGHAQNYDFKVFADETRPLLQGGRLTAYELSKAGIDVTVICDSMASIVMQEGKIDAVLVGTDRIAANGDVANKIGTSGVAILAKEYGIPMYVLGPTSTIDMNAATGDDIPIELRAEEEIAEGFGPRTVPEGVKTYNPAFDVTKAEYVTAIITEHGVHRAPYTESLQAAMKKSS